LAQGLFGKDSPFMQLPGVTYDRFEKVSKKAKGLDFRNFLLMSPEERKKTGILDTEKEWSELEQAVSIFPVFEIQVDGFVETIEKREERLREVRKGDVMTIEVKFNLLSLKQNEERGFIHSNTYPFIKKDNFIVIITNQDGSRIFNFERVYFKGKTNTYIMQWRPQDAMDLNLTIYVKSDSYKGLD
jgi:hypothetical protein